MAPWEWFIGRVCEEFGCLPSAAVRELERDRGLFLVERIMELREFARLKERYSEGTKEAFDSIGDGFLATLIKDIDAGFVTLDDEGELVDLYDGEDEGLG